MNIGGKGFEHLKIFQNSLLGSEQTIFLSLGTGPRRRQGPTGSDQPSPNTKWPYSPHLHLLHWLKEGPVFRNLLGVIIKRYLHLETSH